MQAGAPPCSSQSSTQRKGEVERSGGTLKQVPLSAEGVQPIAQARGARQWPEASLLPATRTSMWLSAAVYPAARVPSLLQRSVKEGDRAVTIPASEIADSIYRPVLRTALFLPGSRLPRGAIERLFSLVRTPLACLVTPPRTTQCAHVRYRRTLCVTHPCSHVTHD